MDAQLFNGVMESVGEAIALSKSEAKSSQAFHVNPVNMKTIRKDEDLPRKMLTALVDLLNTGD